MLDGKRRLAERILRQALARAEATAGRPGLDRLADRLPNATPILEVRPRRVGGATYQVPVEVRGAIDVSLALRWLVKAAASAAARSWRKALRRVPGRIQRAGRRGQAARGHAQDGRGQPGLRHFKW